MYISISVNAYSYKSEIYKYICACLRIQFKSGFIKKICLPRKECKFSPFGGKNIKELQLVFKLALLLFDTYKRFSELKNHANFCMNSKK